MALLATNYLYNIFFRNQAPPTSNKRTHAQCMMLNQAVEFSILNLKIDLPYASLSILMSEASSGNCILNVCCTEPPNSGGLLTNMNLWSVSSVTFAFFWSVSMVQLPRLSTSQAP